MPALPPACLKDATIEWIFVDNTKSPVGIPRTIQGTLLVEHFTSLMSVAMFPTMVPAIALNYLVLRMYKNEEAGEIEKMLKGSTGVPSIQVKGSVLGETHVDLSRSIHLQEKQLSIITETSVSTWTNRGTGFPDVDSITRIKFADAQAYKRITEIIDAILHHKDFFPHSAYYNELPPTCPECKSYMVPNSRFMRFGMESTPPLSWCQKYVCPSCLMDFFHLYDQSRQDMRKTIPDTSQDHINRIKHQLNLADNVIKDALATAVTKVMACHGAFNASEAIKHLESARAFLAKYEEYQKEGFHGMMVEWYQQCIYFLATCYRHSGQLEKALPMLDEGLRFDEQQGDDLNIAKSKSEIGRTLIALGKLQVAERMLQDALALRQKCTTMNPFDRGDVYDLLALTDLFTRTKDIKQLGRYRDDLVSVAGKRLDSLPGAREVLARAAALLQPQPREPSRPWVIKMIKKGELKTKTPGLCPACDGNLENLQCPSCHVVWCTNCGRWNLSDVKECIECKSSIRYE